MPTEYITAAWQKLTAAGWKLKRADHDLIEVTNPGGYTSTMRVRRIPSLARYVHLEPLEAPLTTELTRVHQYYC